MPTVLQVLQIKGWDKDRTRKGEIGEIREKTGKNRARFEMALPCLSFSLSPPGKLNFHVFNCLHPKGGMGGAFTPLSPVGLVFFQILYADF